MLTRAALKTPYAVLAICLIMLVPGALSYRQMRVDIVPEIKIPEGNPSTQECERRAAGPTPPAASSTTGPQGPSQAPQKGTTP